MLDHVLVPLDGSPRSEEVLPHLRRLVRAGVREVTLLRADLPIAMDSVSLLGEATQNQARQYLLGVSDRLADLPIRCRILTRFGTAADTIVAVARERGATLILLSTHRKAGIARWVFGSVSEQVLRESPVPVLLVPPGWSYDLAPALPTELRPVRGILVPLDRDEPSFRILPRAIEMARTLGARIHLLHVRPKLVPDGPEGTEVDGAMEQRMKEAWLQCAASGVETHRRVEEGEVVPVILKVCREAEMDWIAMATHARSGLARWMTGSSTERVLRECGIPMLTVSAASELRANAPKRLSLSGRE